MKDLPGDIEIRELEIDDLERMHEVIHRCDLTYRAWAPADWKPPNYDADLARWRANWGRPHRWARGAYEGDATLVGFISWAQEVDAAERPIAGIAHVGALFVDPRRWRQGIASTLAAMAEAAMVRAGFERVRLWTPEGAPARAFYERQGWIHDGRRTWHMPLGLRVVGYEKELPHADPR